MAYRIVYHKETAKASFSSGLSTFLLTLSCFLLFLTCVHAFWPAGWDFLLTAFIPGEPEATLVAVRCFLEELQHGEPLEEAAATFCHMVTNRDILP